MEYMPGIKISHYEALESAGLDRKRLARLGAEAYLRQLLTDGFFHADPHPGNIAVDTDGTLIFYDFGMMGQIQQVTRTRLMDTFVGIAQRNADQVMSALVELGALAEIDDMGPVRRSIQYILDNMMDKPFEEQSVTAISDDLYAVAYDQPFRFPATFTFVMRAFSTLEGVGKGLDPEFNFMEAAKPYATELMTNGMPGETNNGLFGEISRQAAQVGTSALSLPRRIEDTLAARHCARQCAGFQPSYRAQAATGPKHRPHALFRTSQPRVARAAGPPAGQAFRRASDRALRRPA
ncbi:MAG: AarF/UbiB family protein, partial [Pseudomonadota bacterium]